MQQTRNKNVVSMIKFVMTRILKSNVSNKIIALMLLPTNRHLTVPNQKPVSKMSMMLMITARVMMKSVNYPQCIV